MVSAPPDYMEALRRYWGFESLRPMQEAAVRAALAGRDALTVLPTGGGKSLCYQLPAVISEGLTLVVSPLIALMKDQVDGLRLMGYPAAALNSTLDEGEVHAVQVGIRDGSIRLLYISPERLVAPGVAAMLSHAHMGKGVVRVAIDEAHCISAWGHDFRPEYRQLGKLRNAFPGASIQAFTATATPRVREDIRRQLDMADAEELVGAFDRPNLTYRVVPKENSVATILDAVQRYPDEAVIVYCISRKDTERIADALAHHGVNAAAYHAGLDTPTRSRISEDFARERLNVVVATVAFGMGIDRSNVRCVVHESMPKSIEAYQQETGRAGRDGRPSECILLYNHGDLMRWQRVIREGGDPHQMELLQEVRRFATGGDCRHYALSAYFRQEIEPRCEACDICLDGVELVEGGTKIAHRIIATAHDMLRMNAQFGGSMLAFVLAGARRKEIAERRLDQVRGYGCLKEVHRDRISAWIHQLLDLELLGLTDSEFPVIHATEAGQAALRDRAEVPLRETAAIGKKSARRERSTSGDPLFDLLRAERKAIAAELEVPAYVVFHDSTLAEIARVRPATLQEFRSVSGVGESKAQKFGERFLRIISEYVPTAPSGAEAKYFALFDQGMNSAQVAASLGCAVSTAASYLDRWIVHRRPEDIDVHVTPERQAQILQAMDQVGDGPLKPIKEALPEEFTYEEIRAVRTFARRGCNRE